jgi:hypothetical protein
MKHHRRCHCTVPQKCGTALSHSIVSGCQAAVMDSCIRSRRLSAHCLVAVFRGLQFGAVSDPSHTIEWCMYSRRCERSA